MKKEQAAEKLDDGIWRKYVLGDENLNIFENSEADPEKDRHDKLADRWKMTGGVKGGFVEVVNGNFKHVLDSKHIPTAQQKDLDDFDGEVNIITE